jgi:hypothetical protein
MDRATHTMRSDEREWASFERPFAIIGGAIAASHGEARRRVQSGARRHGTAGIHGNGGSLESATYRI